MLILEGEARAIERKQTDEVVISEFSQEKVLRRFDLSGKIDVHKVKARLQDGILEVIATKLPVKVAKRKGTSGAARSEARRRADAEKAKPFAKGRNKSDE